MHSTINIKISSYQYRDSHVKDKTVSSLAWESPYLGKTVFILRQGPDHGIQWPCSAKFSVFHGTLKISMIGFDQAWVIPSYLQVWALNLMGWCTVQWSRSLFKMALLGQFLRLPRNLIHGRRRLSLREDDCDEIRLRAEIWLHDAVCHAADHYIKWPCFASVCLM